MIAADLWKDRRTRLKPVRLPDIDTFEPDNAFLPCFMEKYNARFAKAPFDDRDVHRALIAGHDDLDESFAWKEERTVSMNLTLQYDQVVCTEKPVRVDDVTESPKLAP